MSKTKVILYLDQFMCGEWYNVTKKEFKTESHAHFEYTNIRDSIINGKEILLDVEEDSTVATSTRYGPIKIRLKKNY